jgi:hypothetical protein
VFFYFCWSFIHYNTPWFMTVLRLWVHLIFWSYFWFIYITSYLPFVLCIPNSYFKILVCTSHYWKTCGQTTVANHPIQLWVVFTWHKPLMILLSGKIPSEIHQSGHAMGGNGGSKKFCPKCLWARLKIFHSTFSNHLGDFFKWSLQALCTRLTTLQHR